MEGPGASDSRGETKRGDPAPPRGCQRYTHVYYIQSMLGLPPPAKANRRVVYAEDWRDR